MALEKLHFGKLHNLVTKDTIKNPLLEELLSSQNFNSVGTEGSPMSKVLQNFTRSMASSSHRGSSNDGGKKRGAAEQIKQSGFNQQEQLSSSEENTQSMFKSVAQYANDDKNPKMPLESRPGSHLSSVSSTLIKYRNYNPKIPNIDEHSEESKINFEINVPSLP